MAATFEDFKKQYEAIKSKVVGYAAAIDKDQRFMGQTVGIIKEGVKEVGLRVQELKDVARQRGEASFFFYDPHETSPKFSHDPTGQAVAGRHTVRFAGEWSQSGDLGRADVNIELIELA